MTSQTMDGMTVREQERAARLHREATPVVQALRSWVYGNTSERPSSWKEPNRSDAAGSLREATGCPRSWKRVVYTTRITERASSSTAIAPTQKPSSIHAGSPLRLLHRPRSNLLKTPTTDLLHPLLAERLG